jgi:hypothetical protein
MFSRQPSTLEVQSRASPGGISKVLPTKIQPRANFNLARNKNYIYEIPHGVLLTGPFHLCELCG